MAMTRPISEQVKFTQDGIGAVERLASEKLREWVSVKDFGAVGDGTDATTAFANAFATGKAVYAPAGTYLLNFLNVPSNTFLFGDGASTIIKPLTPDTRCALGADSGSSSAYRENITIRNVQFLGDVVTQAFSEQNHLTSFNGVKNLLIENCHFIGFRGDGLYIGSGNNGGEERHNINVTVRSCFFDGINKDNRNGISIIDGNGVLIDGCYFTRCTRSNMPGPIDIEPDVNAYHIIKNITVRNCKFFDTGGNVGAISFFLPGVTYTVPPDSFVAEGNYIDTCTANGLFFGYSLAGGISEATHNFDIVFRDNYVKNSGRPFSISNAKNTTIAGNVFNTSTHEALVSYNTANDNVIDATIQGNRFVKCGATGGNGMAVFKSSRVTIADNEFNDCGTGQPGAANALQFNTGTSSSVTVCGNDFLAPTGKTLVAIQKEAGHTFTPNTNSFFNNRLNGLGEFFQWSVNESAVPGYTAEGTAFTPTVYGGSSAGTATYSVQQGFYTKIGKLIHFQISVSWSGHTGTGHLYCSLPENTNANQVDFTAVSVASSGIAFAAGQQPVMLINKAPANRLQLYGLNAGTLAGISVPASGTLYIAGSYLAG